MITERDFISTQEEKVAQLKVFNTFLGDRSKNRIKLLEDRGFTPEEIKKKLKGDGVLEEIKKKLNGDGVLPNK